MSERTPREQLLADLLALRDRYPVTSRHWRRAQEVRDLLWRCWSHRDSNRDTEARVARVAVCSRSSLWRSPMRIALPQTPPCGWLPLRPARFPGGEVGQHRPYAYPPPSRAHRRGWKAGGAK